jgi:hypothetical protein
MPTVRAVVYAPRGPDFSNSFADILACGPVSRTPLWRTTDAAAAAAAAWAIPGVPSCVVGGGCSSFDGIGVAVLLIIIVVTRAAVGAGGKCKLWGWKAMAARARERTTRLPSDWKLDESLDEWPLVQQREIVRAYESWRLCIASLCSLTGNF